MKSFRPIATDLSLSTALLFLLASFLPVAFVGSVALYKIETVLTREILRSHEKLLEQLADDLNAEMRWRERTLSTLARSLEVQSLDPTRMDPVLNMFLEFHPLFHRIAVYRRDGTQVMFRGRGSLSVEGAAPGRLDAGTLKNLDALLASEHGSWIPAPADDSGRSVLSILTPVPSFMPGRPAVGMLVAEMRLDGIEIQDLIGSWSFVDRTYLYITDAQGQIVARAGHGYPGHLRTLSLKDGASRDDITFVSGVGTIHGREDLLAVRLVDKLGLRLIVGRPLADVDQVLAKLTSSMTFFTVLGILFGLSLAAWLAHRIVKPVLLITKGLQRLARGEVAVLKLPSDRPDELGDLARAYQELASRAAPPAPDPDPTPEEGGSCAPGA